MRTWMMAFGVVLGVTVGWNATAFASDEPPSDSEPAARSREEPASVDSSSAAAAALRVKLQSSVRKIADSQTFDLKYRFQTGEIVYWTSQHLVAQETRVAETAQTAKSRSVSTKVWKIVKVEPNGNIVLEYSIDDVDVWQHVSGRAEIRYNSRHDAAPPREYASTAEKLRVPLALVTMDDRGAIIDKTYPSDKSRPSVSELVVPLPKKAVKIGEQWTWTEETRLPLEDKRVLRIQMRHVYSLDRVEKGLATIGMRTEILTPINDPKIRGRLLERMKKGSARFDLEAGRFVATQLDLDETVIGFAGAESILEYKARFTEEIDVGPRPASTSSVPALPAAARVATSSK